jgi:hypothetical protein
LKVQSAVTVTGKVRLDDGIEAHRFMVSVISGSEGATILETGLDQEGRFKVFAVVPGTVSLVLAVDNSWSGGNKFGITYFDRALRDDRVVLHRIESLVIAPSEGSSAPDLDIDLRGLVHKIRVQAQAIVSESDRSAWVEIKDANGKLIQRGHMTEAREFLVGALPLRVEASRDGFFSQTLTEVAGDVDITLRR